MMMRVLNCVMNKSSLLLVCALLCTIIATHATGIVEDPDMVDKGYTGDVISTPAHQSDVQQPQQPQQQPVTPVQPPQEKPSVKLGDVFDDELLRCPAVEFQAKVKEKKDGRYQISFAPDNDVQWVIAHYQINDGEKLNVPLKLRDDALSKQQPQQPSSSPSSPAPSDRSSSELEEQESLRHLMEDMNDFNEEFDLDHDLFDSYTRQPRMTQRRRKSYGVPALLASSAPMSDDTASMDSSSQVDSMDSLQMQQRPMPSLSVSGSGDNEPIMAADQQQASSPRVAFRRSRSRRRRGSGSTSASFKSSPMMESEKDSFVSKQIKLARAMIAMKEGKAAGSDGNVGVWIHDAPFALGENDIVRVWFTYRATKEAPHVDCDTHTLLFDAQGGKKTITTKSDKGKGTGASTSIDQSSSSSTLQSGALQSSSPKKLSSGMYAERVPGSPSPFRQRRRTPRAAGTSVFAEEEKDGEEQQDVCAQADGSPSLALTYPELALAGEKNSYTLILNVSAPSNIRWVDVHYLSADSKLVNLRMTPLPSAAPKPYRLSQSLASTSGPLSSRPAGAMQSVDMDLTKPHWVRVDNKQGIRPRGAFMENKPKSKSLDDDSFNGAEVTADGQFIFTGSFNASDIDKIQIDPATNQPMSLTIGTLNITLNVVGMPGSSFVIAKSDDSSDLRNWKDMNKKQKQLSSIYSRGGDIDRDRDYGYDDRDRDELTDDDYDRLSRSYDRAYERRQPDDEDHTSDDRFVHELTDLDDDIRARQPRRQQQQPMSSKKLPGAYIGGGYPARPGFGRPGYGPYPGYGRYPQGGQQQGEEEATPTDDTTAATGPQLFAHPQSLLLGEGDKIRVFFTFFAPPTYCRTKSFSLIAPAIAPTSDTTPSTTPATTPVAPPAVTPATPPATTTADNATKVNTTGAATASDASPSPSPSPARVNKKVPAEYRLYMGRVLPGQFRSGRGGGGYGGRSYGGGRGYGGSRYGRGGGQRDRDYGDDQYDDSQQQDDSTSDEDQQQYSRPQYPRRRRYGRGTQYGGLNDDSTNVVPLSSSSSSRSGRGRRGQLSVEEPSLKCEQVANFLPSISPIKGLTNSNEDQNNYAINFVSPANAMDKIQWVDVHYQKNNEVPRNYRMEQRALGEFEHIEPGWNEGVNLVCQSSDQLKYSFTFALGGKHHTECDTQQFHYNPCDQRASPMKASGGQQQQQLPGAMHTSMPTAQKRTATHSGPRQPSPAMPSPRINSGTHIPSSVPSAKKSSDTSNVGASQHIQQAIAMNPSLVGKHQPAAAAFSSSSPSSSSTLNAQPIRSPLVAKVLSSQASPPSSAPAAASPTQPLSSPAAASSSSSQAGSHSIQPQAPQQVQQQPSSSPAAAASASPSPASSSTTTTQSSASAAAALQQQQFHGNPESSPSPSSAAAATPSSPAAPASAAANNNNPPYVAVPPDAAKPPATSAGNVPSLTSSTTSLAPDAAANKAAAPITAATLASSPPASEPVVSSLPSSPSSSPSAVAPSVSAASTS